MCSTDIRYVLCFVALLSVGSPVFAVEALSPQQVQQTDQIYEKLDNQGHEYGGRTQEYIDETNADLQLDQPDGRELQNQQDAENLIQQSQDQKAAPAPAKSKSKSKSKSKPKTKTKPQSKSNGDADFPQIGKPGTTSPPNPTLPMPDDHLPGWLN